MACVVTFDCAANKLSALFWLILSTHINGTQ